MSATTRPAKLHLHDPVHVAAGGRVVPVRRKGLAMLAYVALEGPTRRERLADVLWDQQRALPNLRVELHRLRTAFGATGVDPITRRSDALALSPQVEVGRVQGHGLLAGLDDVSAEFQEWLEHRRALAQAGRGHAVRAALLDDLAAHVAPPFVLVLEGAPGSGRRGLTRDLARRLELPFTENLADDRMAVRYVGPDQQDDDGLADRIVRDDRGVWALGRSTFREDSRVLLRLRAQVAPERMRFVGLGPIAWPDARPSLPQGMSFRERARLYLAAGGNPGYLTELVKLQEQGAATGDLPVPQRLRAAILLEASRLSEASRRALERLSVHPGPFSDALLAVLESEHQAEELERMGWLEHDGAAWSFTDGLAARMVRSGVHPGLKMRLHQRIAAQLEREGALTGAAYHRRAATGHGGPEAAPVDPSGPIERRRMHPGRTVWLDEVSVEGQRLSVDAHRLVWSRLATDRDPSRITWRLPTTPLLLRLRGRALVQPDETGALPGTVFLLSFKGCDSGEGATGLDVRFAADGAQPGRLDASERPPLTLGDRFEYWFSVAGMRELWLEAARANAVIEAELEAFEANGAPGEAVEAINLISGRTDVAGSTGADVPVNERMAGSRVPAAP